MNNILKHYLFVCILTLPQLAFAFTTGDSLRYLTPQDTVFLELNEFQEKIFVHRIEYKQTLYSLAKFYGIQMAELISYNPTLIDTKLDFGVPVIIPIPNRAIVRYKKPGFLKHKYAPVHYIVQPGDNLFSVSKRMFKMPVDTIMARNRLTSNILKPGQTLQIGWMSIDGIPDSYRKFRGSPQHKANQALKRIYYQDKTVKKEYTEEGVAFWQKGTKGDSDFYALHRYAPKGSVIAVTNPMTKKTVYAKVIAKLPADVYGKNTIIVVSPKVAKEIGAKDARFRVKLKYVK